MVLDTSLLNIQHYKLDIKGKVEQSREGTAPSSTFRCSSFWKGSLLVALDYGYLLNLFQWKEQYYLLFDFLWFTFQNQCTVRFYRSFRIQNSWKVSFYALEDIYLCLDRSLAYYLDFHLWTQKMNRSTRWSQLTITLGESHYQIYAIVDPYRYHGIKHS